MKICLVGDELVPAGGWADVTKLIVAFRSFANAPKKMTLVRSVIVNRLPGAVMIYISVCTIVLDDPRHTVYYVCMYYKQNVE